jgi:L-threonylcarbamoyladenylate synthase
VTDGAVVVEREAPDPSVIRRAADALLAGELVAFPTETVYGLGALALDPAAAAKIFVAKGRPADNPLIVHVLDVAAARALASSFPAAAEALAAAFWPGPLTLVVPRAAHVPDVVTAGGDTVAVRVPSHPVARALLAAVGQPIAAPSANRSTEVSPTRAEHVVRSLGDRVAMVLDGGACDVGLESAVVDVTGQFARVLRPGTIGRDAIARVVAVSDEGSVTSVVRSPGLAHRHYSPRAKVVLVDTDDVARAVDDARGQGLSVVLLGIERGDVALPRDPAGYAAGLYAALHALDAGADVIVVERPPSGPAWEAAHDRLRRAAE